MREANGAGKDVSQNDGMLKKSEGFKSVLLREANGRRKERWESESRHPEEERSVFPFILYLPQRLPSLLKDHSKIWLDGKIKCILPVSFKPKLNRLPIRPRCMISIIAVRCTIQPSAKTW
jgi:hypothetical protein